MTSAKLKTAAVRHPGRLRQRGSARANLVTALLVISLHASALWWAATHISLRPPRQEKPPLMRLT